jgi:hypothetical protein
MGLFVEVFSLEKDCSVIINLDSVVEIAPLREGGTALFFADTAGVNSRTAMRVRDSYAMFKQFALQTVSAKDITDRFPTKKDAKEVKEVKEKPVAMDIPKL